MSAILKDVRAKPERLLYVPDPKREPSVFRLSLSKDLGTKRGRGAGSFVRDEAADPRLLSSGGTAAQGLGCSRPEASGRDRTVARRVDDTAAIRGRYARTRTRPRSRGHGQIVAADQARWAEELARRALAVDGDVLPGTGTGDRPLRTCRCSQATSTTFVSRPDCT